MARRPASAAKIRIQTIPFFAQVDFVQIDEIRPAAWQQRFWYAALTALAVVALVAVLSGVVFLVGRTAAFLQPLLIPVVAAVILTYLLGPVVDKLCSFGLGRTTAVIVLFLAIGLGLTKSGPKPDEALLARLRTLNRTASIIECSHAPRHWEDLKTGMKYPLEHLHGRHVGALSGIARPESFEEGVRQLGAVVEVSKAFADHHRFTKKEILRFLEWCDRRSLDALVTTEKDAVRFPDIDQPQVPMLFLRVEIEILRGANHWEELLARLAASGLTTAAARHNAGV